MTTSTSQWLIAALTAFCVIGQCNSEKRIHQESDRFIRSSETSMQFIKCCPDDELYRPGLDLCRHGLPVSRQVALLPIYYINTDRHVKWSSLVTFFMKPNDNRMLRADQKKRGILVSCPAGSVAKSSMNFKLYEDFSMKTDRGLMREAGQFCVNAVYPSSNDHELQNAVRYCEPDECHNKSCLRKCCPIGMVVNEVDKTCEQNNIAETFAEDVKQILNVDQSKIPIVSSYGVGIGCQEKYSMSTTMSATNFYILEDGQLYAPDYPCGQRSTRLYCVDNFIRNNATVSRNKFVHFGISRFVTLCLRRQVLKGLRCFPQYKVYTLSNATDIWPSLMADSIFPYLLFTSSGLLVVTFGVYAILREMRNTQGMYNYNLFLRTSSID